MIIYNELTQFEKLRNNPLNIEKNFNIIYC